MLHGDDVHKLQHPLLLLQVTEIAINNNDDNDGDDSNIIDEVTIRY